MSRSHGPAADTPAADGSAAGAPAVGGSAPAGPRHVDGPGWVRGPDGVLRRDAARVLLLDPRDRLLLVRGHDLDRPDRTWWFTVGGGIDPGEDAREAAAREVREETGLALDPAALVGPVLTRSADFDFQAATVHQDEVYFLHRLARDPADLVTDGWTDVEAQFMDEVRWWDLGELARVEVEVFPLGLVDLVRSLLRGWDGVLRHVD